jgi:hypothetical protein
MPSKSLSALNNVQPGPSAICRVIAFVATFALGIAFSLYVAYSAFLASGAPQTDLPGVLIFFGAFGVIFGTVGGCFASLFCARRMRWYHIVLGFGVFVVGLPFTQNPNYSAAAKIIAVIAAEQLIATLLIGGLVGKLTGQARSSIEELP